MSSLKDELPEKFHKFLEQHRYKVAYGGRASGKSWSVARILIEIARRAKVRVMCARELQASISDSVIQLLQDTIDNNGYSNEFNVLKTEIVHIATGSRFMFYGIRHNPTKVKSVEGVDICWVEEAENVSAESWDALRPTMRKKGSEIWVTFNPKNMLDPTYQKLIVQRPKDSYVVKVNYTDNPYFPEVLRAEMEDCKRLDYELYRHVWLGEPVADSEHAFIKPVWVEAAVDAHIKLGFEAEGIAQVGYDVSDEGEDASGMTARRGSVIERVESWSNTETTKVTRAVYAKAYDYGCEKLVYDAIGVGAAARVELKNLNSQVDHPMSIIGFTAGAKVKRPNASYMRGTKKRNKDMFSNLKAQEWWKVRVRFYNTYLAVTKGEEFATSDLISISSKIDNLELLMAEASRPRIDYDNNGRVKVESKPDMRKRKIPSTNLMDSLIMAFSGAHKSGAGLIC